MPNVTVTRFVGLDLHKHFVVAAAVDAQQQLLLKPTRRIDLDDFPAWVAAHLSPQDAVVLEATGNAWWCYDVGAPLVGRRRRRQFAAVASGGAAATSVLMSRRSADRCAAHSC